MTAKQADLFKKARTRRERGIISSILHADADAPGWADRAYMHLLRYAATHSRPFTIEQFRIFALEHGLEPPDELRAFGGVTLRAIHNGVIERVGFAPTSASNGAARALYRAPIREI